MAKKVNSRKWSRIALFFTFSLPLLMQYQNCGQVPQAQYQTSQDGNEPLPVSVIDRVGADAGVAFVENKVSVQPDAYSVALNGICAQTQSGASLRWELFNSAGVRLGEGNADCDMGGFRVELAPIQSLECGQSYSLVAQLGLGQPDTVELKRDCLQ